MKLQEIVPYLAYGVMTNNGVLFALCNDNLAKTKTNDGEILKGKLESIKLVLRPLSDLAKPCLEGGKIPALELVNLIIARGEAKDVAPTIDFDVKIVNKPFGKLLKVTKLGEWYFMLSFVEPDRIKHFLFEKLLFWHFDVYGLIDKGEAIDLNTIQL